MLTKHLGDVGGPENPRSHWIKVNGVSGLRQLSAVSAWSYCPGINRAFGRIGSSGGDGSRSWGYIGQAKLEDGRRDESCRSCVLAIPGGVPTPVPVSRRPGRCACPGGC